MAYHTDAEEQKKIYLEDFYKPPEEVMAVIYDVYTKYIRWRALRDQPYRQFNGMNLISYLEDARQKFWGYLPVSYDDETPQFFFPETRNQIIGILAKMANLRMKPSFEGVEGYDVLKATLLKDLFEYWRRGANRKITNFWQFLYNIINGTIIVHTAYQSKKRAVRDIQYYDPATGETTFRESELDESDVEDVIVNLEDFYFPKLWEPDIQKQNECVWRTLMLYSDFKDEFKGYPESQYVMPGSQFADASIFSEFLSYDVRGSDFVEVIKYYNAVKDRYVIIANGVLLNPVKSKGKFECAPLPWNHKHLPFSKSIFEPLDSTFFFGIPLAQKVKSPQEAINKLWELLLEREERSVAAPIITNDPSVELGIEFRPGRVYQVQGDPSSYKELQVSGASASYWNALMALQGILARTGSGGMSPVLPSRQPRTATEKSLEAQQQREAVGLPTLFYQDLLEQKVWLTIMNMIQFYTRSKVEKVIGERKFRKILSLTDVKLYGGGLGNREIRITESPVSGAELKKESYLRSLLKKERVEIIEVTPQQLQDIRFDIKISFEVENSPETERALYLDFVRTIIALFAPYGLVSPKKLFYRTAEKFNENISDLVEEQVLSDYERERFGVGSFTPKVPGGPRMGERRIQQMGIGMETGAMGAGTRMVNEGIAEENPFGEGGGGEMGVGEGEGRTPIVGKF